MDSSLKLRSLKKFVPAVRPVYEPTEPVLWFAFRGDRVLTETNGSLASFPLIRDLKELGLTAIHRNYLGIYSGRHCYAAEVLEEGGDPPLGMAFETLRRLYARMDDELFALAGRASQIVEWDKTHQFCSRCGSRTVNSGTERAKECPQCGFLSFPRLSPAVIFSVERGDEILLARSPHFPKGVYSVLAGFVDPGESLEDAIVREAEEEVAVSIKNIRYFGSQPWPFPHSLMIAFTTSYAGGEIRIDDNEIEAADWFRAENLPRIPTPMSIARRLIDWFLMREGSKRQQ